MVKRLKPEESPRRDRFLWVTPPVGASVSTACASAEVNEMVIESLAVINQRGETVLVANHLLMCDRKEPAQPNQSH